MSKEYVRTLIFTKFRDFNGLNSSLKNYPNLDSQKQLYDKPWAKLESIDFVVSNIASIGSDPNVRRTGVIVIKAYDKVNKGIQPLTVLTDAIEEHFQLWTNDLGNFWTGAANTIDNKDSGSKIYHEFVVYIPFTYDPIK